MNWSSALRHGERDLAIPSTTATLSSGPRCQLVRLCRQSRASPPMHWTMRQQRGDRQLVALTGWSDGARTTCPDQVCIKRLHRSMQPSALEFDASAPDLVRQRNLHEKAEHTKSRGAGNAPSLLQVQRHAGDKPGPNTELAAGRVPSVARSFRADARSEAPPVPNDLNLRKQRE